MGMINYEEFILQTMLIVSLKIRNLLPFKSLIERVDYLYISIVISLQICLLLQLFYVIVIHRKLASFRSVEANTELKLPVSVIICARNEEKTISRCIASILNQDYDLTKVELILINDASKDKTVVRAEKILTQSKIDYKII